MFQSSRSFIEFEAEVKGRRRFFVSERSLEFIDALRESVPRHLLTVSSEQRFWRTQLAHEMVQTSEGKPSEPQPCSAVRMKPQRGKAREGRANYKGIPCLYVASDPRTAIAESRPGLGSLITLARVTWKRPLRLVDCGTSKIDWERVKSPRPEEREASIWSQLNVVFSEPVSRSDDVGEYVATQILAELFLSMGFDGVAYRSSFGSNGYNVAAFDPEPAEIETCSLYRVKDISYSAELAGVSSVFTDEKIGDDHFVWDPLAHAKVHLDTSNENPTIP